MQIIVEKQNITEEPLSKVSHILNEKK